MCERTKMISHKRKKHLGILSLYATPFYLLMVIAMEVLAKIKIELTTQSANPRTSKENKYDTQTKQHNTAQ